MSTSYQTTTRSIQVQYREDPPPGENLGREVTQTIQVEVQLDIAGIAKALGPKAFRSKRGLSQALSGLVKVKYVR